jgi:hypothetical protein
VPPSPDADGAGANCEPFSGRRFAVCVEGPRSVLTRRGLCGIQGARCKPAKARVPKSKSLTLQRTARAVLARVAPPTAGAKACEGGARVPQARQAKSTRAKTFRLASFGLETCEKGAVGAITEIDLADGKEIARLVPLTHPHSGR